MFVRESPAEFRRLASTADDEPNVAAVSAEGQDLWLRVTDEDEDGRSRCVKGLFGSLEFCAVTFLVICGFYLLITHREELFSLSSGGNVPQAQQPQSGEGGGGGGTSDLWKHHIGPFMVAALSSDLAMYLTCGLLVGLLSACFGNGLLGVEQARGFVSVSVFALSSILWLVLCCWGGNLLLQHWRKMERVLLAWVSVETMLAAVYVAMAAPFFAGIGSYLIHKVGRKLRHEPLVPWNYAPATRWWRQQSRYTEDALELGLLLAAPADGEESASQQAAA